MAEVTLAADGGKPYAVTRGAISMPRIGAWHADLHVDGTAAFAGKVTLQVGEKLALQGTVNRARVHQGTARVRVVAGGDGLQKTARPKHYNAPTFGIVLRELAAAGGEEVSATADQAVVTKTLLAWTTLRLSVGVMIGALVDLAPDGTAWRTLPDGKIWIGAETWPDSGLKDYREIDETPEQASMVIGTDVPQLLPGTQLGGRKIDYVEHLIGPNEFRTRAWTHPWLTTARAALAAPADALLRYRCMYRAKVVSQNSDLLRVGLKPEEALLPSMANVPLRTGIPGLTAKVSAGAIVLVGWENGKPNRPFAAMWASPSGRGEGNARGDSGEGGGAVVKLTLVADTTELGGKDLNPITEGALNATITDNAVGLPHWMLGNGSSKVFVKK
jgi:hypothetical protein